jgi:FRG domain
MPESRFKGPSILGPVENLPELEATIARLKETHPGYSFLYRGQTTLHPKIRSSKARDSQATNLEVEAGWRTLAFGMLGLPYVEGNSRFMEAILQHYGAPTRYIDLTDDLEVAAWFAVHQSKRDTQRYMGTCLRSFTFICYERIQAEHGYVLVLALPNPKSLVDSDLLFPLKDLPGRFVRPNRQRGWLMLDQPPVIPDPNDFWICSIPVVAKTFGTDLTSEYLFPGVDQDPAFRTLATLPYVQVPAGYFPSESEKEGDREDQSLETFCFGWRALELPEYLKSPREEAINHKWNDFVIYEPHPMRMWRNWRSDLKDKYPERDANIGFATKITVGPEALSLLKSEANAACSWPSVQSDNILFTFAGLDHDKVSEHGPTYEGVWLHREGDLIIETPVDSDEKVMSTCPGHGYLLREGRLNRVQIAQCCTCSLPETHDHRVFSVLQISRLVREGKLLFLPHARLSKLGWFVVLGPNESQLIQPSVDSFHKIMKGWQQQLDQKPSDLDSEERNYLDRLRQDSAIAFQNAIPLSSDDQRWISVDGMIKDLIAGERMADELPSCEVGGQLVLCIPQHSGIESLPSVAILYVWPTVFGQSLLLASTGQEKIRLEG